MKHLTILICTHNRATLLERTLGFVNNAARPAGWEIDILVVANACTDGTVSFLKDYTETAEKYQRLPLTWIEEPAPGKSHALNRAIPELHADVVAFVDDDHRVDELYLSGICAAAQTHPDTTMFCGRILPDWDGSEPAWVHDEGPYRIYPLPVPRFDQGDTPFSIEPGGPVPGGGNLFLRPGVLGSLGGFSTELGPQGHNLQGGEDTDFVLRALKNGEQLRYEPDVVQYHYVDIERLRLKYLLQKSFQRSRSVVRTKRGNGGIPLYMWRKLAGYIFHAVFSLRWEKKRFYFVRTAAVLGELFGILDISRSSTYSNTSNPR